MNNFIMDELLAEEYRNARLSEAKKHNQMSQIISKTISLRLYKILANLGTRIENFGTKVESYYNCLAVREKRNILAND